MIPSGPCHERIASRVSQLNGEGALAVYSRAKELEKQGRSIIHLELGEPDFHPAAPVVDAVRARWPQGATATCSTRGIPALREAIAEYLKRTRRLNVAAGAGPGGAGLQDGAGAGDDGADRAGRRSALSRSRAFRSIRHSRAGWARRRCRSALEEKNQFQPDLAEIAAKDHAAHDAC